MVITDRSSAGIFLSCAELRGVRDASQILLSPGEYQDRDEWRSIALRAVMNCLGADMGFFMYRSGAGVTDTIEQDIPRVDEYPARVLSFALRLGLWERQQEQCVWSRPTLWGRHLREMFKSEYYVDYVKALRGFDTVGLTVPIDKMGGLATFHLFHGSERGVRFGERGLALLRLIEPSFRVGVSLSLNVGPRALRGLQDGPDIRETLPMLSDRERAVVEMLAARRTNREIAAGLGVAVGTVKRHVENILQKVGVRSRRDIEPLLDRRD